MGRPAACDRGPQTTDHSKRRNQRSEVIGQEKLASGEVAVFFQSEIHNPKSEMLPLPPAGYFSWRKKSSQKNILFPSSLPSKRYFPAFSRVHPPSPFAISPAAERPPLVNLSAAGGIMPSPHCQGAPKVYHSGAVESVPPLIRKFSRFSPDNSGGSTHGKQVKDGTKTTFIRPLFTELVCS